MNVEPIVYWRPGCPYCAKLFRDLERIGLPVSKVNIWEDRAGAARVRSIADGNETVPTVVVGDDMMVNPRVGQVLDAVRRSAPDLLTGLDTTTTEPWYRGLGMTLLAALGWFALAISHPTTTYHFGPAIAAAAWPLVRRARTGRPLPPVAALLTGLGGVVVAAATTLVLQSRGALEGPVLLGVSPVGEAVISAAVGAAVAVVLSQVRRRRS